MTKLPIRNPAGVIVGLMGFFTEIGEQPQVWASAYEDELLRHEEIAGSVHSMDYTLFYQPIFDVRSGELASVEALLRWSPTAGEVRTPDGFLPHLEATGLIRPVGLWVVEEASRQLREWRDRYESAADLTVAVNISRVQFESPTLVEDVTERVLANRLDPDSVTLEITETAASSAEADIVSGLLSFRDQGFSIALDDFGVGQSSLSVLCDLPIEIVKVDRSFITSPDTSTSAPRTARISARDHVLRSVVGLVRNLGLKTTVEGVETKEQYERLRAMACDMVQGFWPARPMPATEIAKLF